MRKKPPCERVCLHLPSSLINDLRTELHSELEDRVPYGAMTDFFTELLMHRNEFRLWQIEQLAKKEVIE